MCIRDRGYDLFKCSLFIKNIYESFDLDLDSLDEGDDPWELKFQKIFDLSEEYFEIESDIYRTVSQFSNYAVNGWSFEFGDEEKYDLGLFINYDDLKKTISENYIEWLKADLKEFTGKDIPDDFMKHIENEFNISRFFTEYLPSFLNEVKNITSFFSEILYIPAGLERPRRLLNYQESERVFLDFFSLCERWGYMKWTWINDLNHWLREFDIGEELILERLAGIGTKVLVKRGSNNIDINDLGFGSWHLIVLILKLIVYSYSDYKDAKKHFFIEEPEVNLHPALQSKLADLFLHYACLGNVQLFVETHSEYLVRKLQYHVAEKYSSIYKIEEALKMGDKYIWEESDLGVAANLKLYYFNKPGIKPEVVPIQINKNGLLLQPFGPGFFDEADNLTIDLYNMSKISKK